MSLHVCAAFLPLIIGQYPDNVRGGRPRGQGFPVVVALPHIPVSGPFPHGPAKGLFTEPWADFWNGLNWGEVAPLLFREFPFRFVA